MFGKQLLPYFLNIDCLLDNACCDSGFPASVPGQPQQLCKENRYWVYLRTHLDIEVHQEMLLLITDDSNSLYRLQEAGTKSTRRSAVSSLMLHLVSVF